MFLRRYGFAFVGCRRRVESELGSRQFELVSFESLIETRDQCWTARIMVANTSSIAARSRDDDCLHRDQFGCDDRAMDDWVAIATGLLAGHPAVTSIEFAGSRSRGTHEQLSDWDFAVETTDFEALARDLPALAPLDPLGQQ